MVYNSEKAYLLHGPAVDSARRAIAREILDLMLVIMQA